MKSAQAEKASLPRLLSPLRSASKSIGVSIGRHAKGLFSNDNRPTQLSDDESDDEIQEIDTTDFLEHDHAEESLTELKKHLETKAISSGAQQMIEQANEQGRNAMQKVAELPEDYVRNFMYHRGLIKALEAFQNEWYEFKLTGKLRPEDTIHVSSVYKQNEKMSEMLTSMREEVEKHQHTVSDIKRNFGQLTRERDYHRMHHKRLQHEKDKLIEEVKKMAKEMEKFEPIIKQSQAKVDVLIKEKSLAMIERDRLANKVKELEKKNEELMAGSNTVRMLLPDSRSNSQTEMYKKKAGSNGSISKASVTSGGHASQEKPTSALKRTNPFPEKDRHNPFEKFGLLASEQTGMGSDDLPSYFDGSSYVSQMKQMYTFKAHSGIVTGMCMSKDSSILATSSSDKTWKLWQFDSHSSPSLLSTNEGHKNIVTGIDFHPHNKVFATCSGDNTVKIWDYEQDKCLATLKEHIQPVWSCQYHDMGNIILSTSMDHTIKLWDVEKGKSRQTIRHHSDSVKHGAWKPYSNTFVTCSSDKKIAIWDARHGICLHNFTQNAAINHVSFSKQGNHIATCNSAGLVVVYDIRKMQVVKEIQIANQKKVVISTKPGPNPKISLNTVEFHLQPEIIVVGGNDGFVRVLDWSQDNVHQRVVPWMPSELPYNDPSSSILPFVEETGMNVCSLLFDTQRMRFLSSGSDGNVRLY